MNAQVMAMRQAKSIGPVPTPDFCQAMRNLAGACVVIASADGSKRAGLTATAVCSITADPPQLLVCVNRNVYAHGVISDSRNLSVNVLGQQQEPIAKRFAGMVEGVVGEERFADGLWADGLSGVPVLQDALVSFECQVVEVIPASTHDMFLCEVIGLAGRMNQQSPLMYFNGNFAALG
ncbi:flavin reductase family protein [Pseudomonas taeanensis]|nr:flavin reductase family protein [Pseudomonas taeanensis]